MAQHPPRPRIVRTEVHWGFTPVDLLHAPFDATQRDLSIRCFEGKVVGTLSVACENMSPARLKEHERLVRNILTLASVRAMKSFTLAAPDIVQYYEDGTSRKIVLASGTCTLSLSVSADFEVHDSAGRVTFSSREERISGQAAFVTQGLRQFEAEGILSALIESFYTAMRNPDHELVHLYEIRDALQRHFGNARAARTALGVTEAAWQRLGELANTLPLTEGRHRGVALGQLRRATSYEVREARQLSFALIERYMTYLDHRN